MCGIIAVLSRLEDRPARDPGVVREAAAAAREALAAGDDDEALARAAEHLATVDDGLRGVAGIRMLLEHGALGNELLDAVEAVDARVGVLEAGLEEVGAEPTPALEHRNALLLALKDRCWAVRNDRLPAAEAVRDLAGGVPATGTGIGAWAVLDTVFSALDRLEVRGRDSAGVSLLVTGLDDTAPELDGLLAGRADPLYAARAARRVPGGIDIVLKAAAEIGELGDNVRALRDLARSDALLRWAFGRPGIQVTAIGHTRWASVGTISEPNAHPLNQEERRRDDGPYAVAALNGDVDNHLELRRRHRLEPPEGITTDAKVIPVLFSRRLAEGQDSVEAFRSTVAEFEGSVAIAGATPHDPDRLMLALRGSGQALYVGLADDAFVVASELYGLVEETPDYLRLDGGTPGNPANPRASRGQVVVLERTFAGTAEGIRRRAFDGTELPVAHEEIQHTAITTRDIDRGDHPHFLVKEIHEAPRSLSKTLRGRIARRDGRLRAAVGEDVLPAAVRGDLAAGRVREVLCIGQGTAAVAAQGVAAAMERCVGGRVRVVTLPATELSGFHLREDMAGTLVVAISQSGTTTDTNRTVDLVRGRGARVVAIVNRRGSDLTDKADGVLYTSDGRDVEMSVASTKAFYAQIAAGWLLALALAEVLGAEDPGHTDEILSALRGLPGRMEQVLGSWPEIERVAARFAPRRRYWALVGNGPNRVAANEVRIKLSELCYKSIAADATEDKKHIDLSAEPMILVCAAGLPASTADDVAKEVAIYRAHKAAPVVFTDGGVERFGDDVPVIGLPATHPDLAYVLATMAGHLFGYAAARAIDASAAPLRRARAAVEAAAEGGDGDPFGPLRAAVLPFAQEFQEGLEGGRYDGSLEPGTAARLVTLLTAVTGAASFAGYRIEVQAMGTPGALVDDLLEVLGDAIEQLTRPIDAIKHQAKTVTVGITRADEALLTTPLVQALLAAGARREHVTTRDLRALAALEPAVAQVRGATRYAIVPGAPGGDGAQLRVVTRRGISEELPSRTDENPVLRGTKHLVALEQEMLIGVGRGDGRTFALVPEVEDGETRHLTLLHLAFRDRLEPNVLHGVLSGYRKRWTALHDAVLETEESFDPEVLARQPVTDLLTLPIHLLAERW